MSIGTLALLGSMAAGCAGCAQSASLTPPAKEAFSIFVSPSGVPFDLPLPPGAVRQRLVTVDRQQIQLTAALAAQRVSVQFFGDEPALAATRDRVSQVSGGRQWSGHFSDPPGYLVLTDGPAGTFGVASIVGRGVVQLRGVGGDLVVAVEGRRATATACALQGLVDEHFNAKSTPPKDTTTTPAFVDVLMFYTDGALCSAGVPCGSPEARAAALCQFTGEVRSWLDSANQLLSDSHVWVTLRLAGLQPLAVSERLDLDAMVKELNSASSATGSVVRTMRRGVPADIVGLVVSTGGDDGMAHPLDPAKPVSTLGDQATFIVRRSAAILTHTFAHEISHVMGAGHQDGSHGVFGYSRAWYDGPRAHTVMAVGLPGELWGYLSNMFLPYSAGVTIGSAAVDNAGTLNTTRFDVSQWQQRDAPPFLSPCGEGLTQ